MCFSNRFCASLIAIYRKPAYFKENKKTAGRQA
jgi:hypothetical protein